MALAALLFIAVVPCTQATTIGTSPTAPGNTVIPGLVPPGTLPGSLLASQSDPFVSLSGADSGTIDSAVYQEASGTLDFYYQVDLNASSIDPLSRLALSDFTGFQTSVGFLTDGGTALGGIFADGSITPYTADRDVAGDVVGFNFGPDVASKIQPGTDSVVMVVSTDATSFTNGFASVIDGIPSTVYSYAPAPTSVPEPATPTLLASGLVGLGLLRLRRRLGRC